MTRKDAISELIAKVGAGEWPQRVAWKAIGVNNTNRGNRAFHGSVDAAISWLGAVLPFWIIGQIGQSVGDGSGVWNVWIVAPDYLESCMQSCASSSCPARALLLAGLRALHAQEQA